MCTNLFIFGNSDTSFNPGPGQEQEKGPRDEDEGNDGGGQEGGEDSERGQEEERDQQEQAHSRSVPRVSRLLLAWQAFARLGYRKEEPRFSRGGFESESLQLQ